MMASVYVAAILGIREANVDRLVKEDDIRMHIPADRCLLVKGEACNVMISPSCL